MADIDYERIGEVVEEITADVREYYDFGEEEVVFYGFYVIKHEDYGLDFLSDENSIEILIGYNGYMPEAELNLIMNDNTTSVSQKDLAFECYSIEQTGDLNQILYNDVGIQNAEVIML